MNRFFPAFVLMLFVPVAATAQPMGRVDETLMVESAILDELVNVSVYYPPDYSISKRFYPVLYLLHGYSDDHTGWTQFGEVRPIADAAILSGKATPMIIVMPDAKKTFYVNRADGKYSYEDFFTKELIPFVESKLPVKAKKEFRAVAGLSMGGYGTFLYALKHGELFAAACPLSASIQSDESIRNMPYERYKNRFEEFFGEVVPEGEDRITETWKASSIENILKNRAADIRTREEAFKKMSDEEKKATAEERRKATEAERRRIVRFYIDCGDDDFLFMENLKVPAWLHDARIPFEFRVRDGAHNWRYWRTALPEVMEFVSDSFRR